jgi:integrase
MTCAVGRDPKTGKYPQKWERFRGTRQQAEERRTELLGQKDKGQLAAPSKLTVGAYLDEWLKTTESSRAPKTHRNYAGIINDHVKPALGNVLLQKLNVLDVERYYTDATGAQASRVCATRCW